MSQPFDNGDSLQGREPTNADIIAHLTPIGRAVGRIDQIVTGNGDPAKGLVYIVQQLAARVDKLEDTKKNQVWWTRAAIVAGLGAIATWAVEHWKH